jgi:hypothetical protein
MKRGGRKVIGHGQTSRSLGRISGRSRSCAACLTRERYLLDAELCAARTRRISARSSALVEDSSTLGGRPRFERSLFDING